MDKDVTRYIWLLQETNRVLNEEVAILRRIVELQSSSHAQICNQAAATEWVPVWIGSDDAKRTCRSWFSHMLDDCEILKAEILTDIATDKEKALRARVRFPDGQEKVATRTLGKRTFSISFKAAA